MRGGVHLLQSGLTVLAVAHLLLWGPNPVTFVTLVLVMATWVWLIHGLVRPTLKVSAAARRVSSGEPGVRVELPSPSPMGELADAFNVMAANLDRGHGALAAEALVENLGDIAMVVDDQGTIRFASQAATNLLGRPSSFLAGHRLAALVHPDDRLRLTELCAAPRSEDPWPTYVSAELRLSHLHGTWIVTEATATNLIDHPHIQGVMLTLRDIGRRKLFEEELRHLALHDSLTNLANRALFRDHVEHALARIRSTKARPHAVLFVDLDDFKTVNDSLGHVAGDQVLVEFAGRLRALIRPGDTAARVGGDEFAVLLENSSEKEAANFAQTVLECLRSPVTLDGSFGLHSKELVLTGSLGVALSSPDQDAGDLLRNADAAMYVAKASGKGRYEVFKPEMQLAALHRLDLETELRRAIDHQEFLLHYQPIVSLPDGTMTGVEALVRWNHPQRGLILPADFIPVAEETGLIRLMGRWTLEEACRQMRLWHDLFPGPRPLRLCVNASVRQIEDEGFIDEMAHCLDHSGLDPESLTLEITESLFMQDLDGVVRKLCRLKDLGIKLAVDDFGTGYSSLRYMGSLPLDLLKIDKGFVAGVTADPEQSAIVQAVIQLAQTFGLETVAEGIERADQLHELAALGTDMGQGYYFSRPSLAPEIESLLASRTPCWPPLLPTRFRRGA